MPLRCLLFSSDEGLTAPIWQVLADLGIEGEYCRNAVEAVERVTTQLFQIVITDWDDQPEAEFLLKTARELKAAHRPLTLAIVKEDSHLPLALQAGANSILRKPLVPDAMRDTLSTARDLLRAKLEPAGTRQASAPAKPLAVAAAAGAAAASAAPATAPMVPVTPASAPASVTRAPENPFRKGEFLQSTSTDPGKQFDTGTDSAEAKSAEQAAIAEQDPLNELEPMAASVEAAPEESQPKKDASTGWASIQERLAKRNQQPEAIPPSEKAELLGYGDNRSSTRPASQQESDSAQSPVEASHPEIKAATEFGANESESAEEFEAPAPAKSSSRMVKVVVAGALAAGVLAVVKVPAAHQSFIKLTAPLVSSGKNWLNPPPAAPPQSPAEHETFGQAGDEYKLPVATNIPDATTDPSQIRVLPVIDPTIKPANGSGSAAQTQVPPAPADGAATEPGQPALVQSSASPNQNPGTVLPPPTDPSTASPASSTTAPVVVPQTQPTVGPAQIEAAPPRPTSQPQPLTAQHPISNPSNSGIPTSLRSQIASMTPEASGTKPVEAALSAIQPVDVPESTARGLLLQQVDPAYPDAAKNSHQPGTVILQVLIASDGTVQDAKFQQGSLVFARAAIDAVRQWRFKPYQLNGRAASAKTVITLNFRPPA